MYLLLRLKLYVALLLPMYLITAGRIPDSFLYERDYKVFYTVIHEKEGTLDLHTAKDSIEFYFTELKNELPHESSLLEQYKLYSKTLNRLKCGHTQIYPNKRLFREWLQERKALPFDYYIYDGRLYINELDEADKEEIYSNKHNRERLKKIPEHAEIYMIDEMTLDEMMGKIGPYISSDEDQIEFKLHQAGQVFEFYRHLAMPFYKDTAEVAYLDQDDTVTIKLVLGEAPVHTMNKRIYKYSGETTVKGSQYGEFKLIRDEYAWFRFRSFNACGGIKYRDFLRSSFRKINEAGIDKLVIDLRGNTGGVMQYDLMSHFTGGDVTLGKYVVAKPSFETSNRYIKKTAVDFIRHRRMSTLQRRKDRKGKFNDGVVVTREIDSSLIFTGQVIVITDESTFSSAAMLACHLKTLAGAKIVGRTPGGSFYKGNSGTLQVKLPESGFNLMVNPNTFYSHLETADDPRLIKEPDLVLNPKYMEPRKLEAYYFSEAVKLFKQN